MAADDGEQHTAPDPDAAQQAPSNPPPGTPAPSAEQQNPAECVDQTGDYVDHAGTVTYVIGLTNKCDKRVKCVIDAYVVGARGPASGHATLTLGAASSGAAAKKTYAMTVKSAGGIAQVSRDCQVF
jgi:hypothetical protein